MNESVAHTKMEPERYTQFLPADLTQELARRLDWRALYEAYISLPEYRRYDDPKHRLWRELYRRDLSTYPPPDDVDIREQYFWGRALVDSLDLSPKKLEKSLITLIRLGYDVPLGRLITNAITKHVVLSELIKAAITGGYISILELLYSAYPDVPHVDMLDNAIKSQRLDVLDYYLKHITSAEMEEVHNVIWLAAVTGRVDIFNRLFDFVKSTEAYRDIRYCDYMNTSAESSNIELLTKMIDQCQPTKNQFAELLTQTHHVATLRFVVDKMVERGYIEGLDDIDPEEILAVAVSDCDVDHLSYALSRGVELRWHHYAELARCNDPRIHQWIAENRPQREYESIISWIIDRRPELAYFYLDSLTKPVKSATDILMSALYQNNVDLVRRIIEDPNTRMSGRDLDIFITEHRDIPSADMMAYLLSKLPRNKELNLLTKLSPAMRSVMIHCRNYTQRELSQLDRVL